MKQSRFSRVVDYAPPVVAFIAAIGAVLGAPKWDEQAHGLQKLTLLGWAVIGIGLVALIASILVTRKNHSESATQRATKAHLAKIGQDQILRGLRRMVCVFRNSSSWHPKCEEPTSPLDLLALERRSALSTLNLNSLSHYATGKGSVKWWEMFENTANQGAKEITTALQIYVTFLDPKVTEAATTLLNCQFQHCLEHIHDIVDANTRGEPDRPVRFFWVDPKERYDAGYAEYWTLVARLIELCTDKSPSEKATWADPSDEAGD